MIDMFMCDHENNYRVFDDNGKEFILQIEIFNNELSLTINGFEVFIAPNGKTEYFKFDAEAGFYKKCRRSNIHSFILDKYYEILPHFADIVREVEEAEFA